MSEESTTLDDFEFIGGRLCLDFINTLSDRFRARPVEILNTYTDLLAWSQLAHILDAGQAEQLRSRAERDPILAAHWLAETKRARAVLVRILSTIAGGQAALVEEIRQFNRFLSETMVHLCLVPERTGFIWDWTDAGDHLDLPLWFVVRDAAELLTSPELRSLRMCASDDCDWLFLDTSKNHSRRWCAMKTCGNRAKAHNYYDRQKLANGV